jgi:hypothetical protein
MSRMTRTQISLDESQYRYLRAEAARRSTSISALIREMVDKRMDEGGALGGLEAICGMFSDGSVSGADHDRLLYEDLVRRKLSGRG